MSHYDELEVLDPRSSITSPRSETVTPHKVAILMLVQQYLKIKKATAESGLTMCSRSRRNFCMLLLKLIQYPDMTYNEMHYLITSYRYKIDPLHLQGFEKAMSELFTVGIESLFDFAELQNIEKLLSEQLGVSQFSLVGLYIRRVGVTLERLSFPEILQLYKNVCFYYEKGIRTLCIGPRRKMVCGGIFSSARTMSTPCPPAPFDDADEGPDTDDDEGECESVTDDEEEDVSDDTLASRSSHEESVMDTDTVHQDRNTYAKWSIKQADLFVSQQSGLLETNERRALPPWDLHNKCLEIIRDNPLHTHAHFLLYMNQIRVMDYFGSKFTLHRSFDRSPMQMICQEDQKGMQYFSLNLGVLHANFDHHKEAYKAFRECIMLAQENSDKRCLDLANSWMGLVARPTEAHTTYSLTTEITDPIQAQTLSHGAQFSIISGVHSGQKPKEIFELLLKCDELNSNNSILEHATNAMALRSALWAMYGVYDLSSACAQLLLRLKKVWAFGDVGNTESVCRVLASLAMHFHYHGGHSLTAVILQHAHKRFPRYPICKSWMISYCVIQAEQAMYSYDWDTAAKACDMLDNYDALLAKYTRARLYFVSRCSEDAYDLLNSLLHEPQVDVLMYVRILLMLAHVEFMEEAFNSRAVNFIIRALHLSQKYYLTYEEALASMTMAIYLLKLKLYSKAFEAIDSGQLDALYISGSLYDQSKLDFVYTQALVLKETDQEKRQHLLTKSLPILDRAADAFIEIGAYAKALDIYVFLLKHTDEWGMIDVRDKYANLFIQYQQQVPDALDYMDMDY